MRMEPPATPPLSSSTSAPGLLTSNDRITISLGSEVKSRTGMGMRFTIYSLTASILYLSCAEMGTIGDVSATVPTRIQGEDRDTVTTRHDEPLTKAAILFWCSKACASFIRSTL